PWSGYPTPYFAGTEFLSRWASAYTPSGMRSSSRRRLRRRSEDVTASPARPSEVALLWADLDPFGHEVVMQNSHVGQISVPLGEIEPVADHEAVRDLEAHVADVHVDLAPLGLRQEGADLEAGRGTGLEVPDEVGECQARVDDVLDHEDVPALDVDVEVLEDPDDPGGVGRGA